MGVIFTDPDLDLSDVYWYMVLAEEMDSHLWRNEGLITLDSSADQSCKCTSAFQCLVIFSASVPNRLSMENICIFVKKWALEALKALKIQCFSARLWQNVRNLLPILTLKLNNHMLLSEFSSIFIRNKIYFCKTSINPLSQNRGTESPEGTDQCLLALKIQCLSASVPRHWKRH